MRTIVLLLLLVGTAGLLAPAPVQAQTPYLGEIRLISFNFPPKGWTFCNGQLLPINQNQALFALLGTTYGGDGRQTFALPDLRGRVGVSFGQGPGLGDYALGEKGGQEFHTLTVSEMPAHSHAAIADSIPGTAARPDNLLPARNGAAVPHYGQTPSTQLSPSAIGATGGGQPHENRPPSLVMNYIIALQGTFPAQSGPGVVGAQSTSVKATTGGTHVQGR